MATFTSFPVPFNISVSSFNVSLPLFNAFYLPFMFLADFQHPFVTLLQFPLDATTLPWMLLRCHLVSLCRLWRFSVALKQFPVPYSDSIHSILTPRRRHWTFLRHPLTHFCLPLTPPTSLCIVSPLPVNAFPSAHSSLCHLTSLSQFPVPFNVSQSASNISQFPFNDSLSTFNAALSLFTAHVSQKASQSLSDVL